MKIRHGFVSNSSSSSFIIRVFDDRNFSKEGRLGELLLSREQIKKLEKFGFIKTLYTTAENFYHGDRFCLKDEINLKEKINKNDYYAYGYYVSCNQSDVIEFLVKNKIPFSSYIHYGEYVYVYTGGKYIYNIANYGNILGSYYNSKTEFEKNINTFSLEKICNRIPVTNYLPKSKNKRNKK